MQKYYLTFPIFNEEAVVITELNTENITKAIRLLLYEYGYDEYIINYKDDDLEGYIERNIKYSGLHFYTTVKFKINILHNFNMKNIHKWNK